MVTNLDAQQEAWFIVLIVVLLVIFNFDHKRPKDG